MEVGLPLPISPDIPDKNFLDSEAGKIALTKPCIILLLIVALTSGEESSCSEGAGTIRDKVQHLLHKPHYSMLKSKETITEDILYLSLFRETCSVLEELGPVDNPRLLFKFAQNDHNQVSYAFQVHFTAIESGSYDEELVKARLDQLVPSSGYILCPGLQSSDLMHVMSKNLRRWPSPFKRVDSKNCTLFHIPQNRKLHPHHHLKNMCTSCKTLSNQVLQIKKRNDEVTEEVKLQRRMPNSRYPLSLLSPKSQEIRNRSVRTLTSGKNLAEKSLQMCH